MHHRGELDKSAIESGSAEEFLIAKNIIHSLLRAKKTVKIYLSNNPMYGKSIQELYESFSKYFQYNPTFKISIAREHLFFDNKPVYYTSGKSDNLALLLFKDGLRELTFYNDLSIEEIEEFLMIINVDFDKDALDDDIVTLLWERDFNYIRYVSDENYLPDSADYEANALKQIQEKESDPDCYQKAHTHFIKTGEDVLDMSIDMLSDEDLKILIDTLERDDDKKAAKLTSMLFEIMFEADSENDYLSVSNYFKIVIEFLIHKGSFKEVVNLQSRLKQAINSGNTENNTCAENIMQITGGYEVLKLIGICFDTNPVIDKDDFDKYISFLDERSIMPLMDILTELQTIHGRKMFIDALVHLSKDNARELIAGLSDQRWYVIRNTIHILRKVGSREFLAHIVKTLKHKDLRVKKESLRFLGEHGGDNVIPVLINCLKDDDSGIRTETLRAIKSIGSCKAKKTLMEQITDKHFAEKEFSEKKIYLEALAGWDDDDVQEFLVNLMNKKALWKGIKYYELKACVAYCMGLLGKRTALPLLDQFRTDENVILREHACGAIKRIEDGQK